MKVKELKDYDEYVRAQDSRSGLNLDCNTLFDDLKKANIEIGKDSYILDIGCRAAARTVRKFVDAGYNCFGIDIGYEAESNWNRKLNKYIERLKRFDIHNGIPFEYRWDLITISHTLEHCYDADKVVSIMRESMMQGGLVHSIVPIEETYDDFLKHTPHLTMFESHNEHKLFYSERGFEIVYDFKDINDTRDKTSSIIIAQKK